MNVRLLTGICFFGLSTAAAICGNVVVHRMIDQINRHPGNGPDISHFMFSPGKLIRIVTDYRSLYPEGKLGFYLRASVAGLVVGFVGLVFCLMVRFQ
jgi:hypothetical protein